MHLASHLSLATHGLLALTALFAGFVDAVAGGGGLITVPALLAAGLPPQLALGTNKGQSVFGSGTAFARYARSPLLDRELALRAFPLGLIGSLVGVNLLLLVSPKALRPVVIVLLVAVAIFLAVHRTPRAPSRVRHAKLAAAVASLVLGAYDGFFGPGTGAFLIVAFVALLGRPLDAATADAKAVNFASNLAAVSTFALRGCVLWDVALPMAAAQALGAFLGAHATVHKGERLVRPMALVVVGALVLKLAHDLYG